MSDHLNYRCYQCIYYRMISKDYHRCMLNAMYIKRNRVACNDFKELKRSEYMADYEKYEPVLPDIVKFDDIGDQIEGRFVGFKEGKFGTMIQIELENGQIVALPNLTKFKQMIPDVEIWNNNFKEIYFQIERIEDIPTDKGSDMKDFEIMVKKQ